MEGISINRNEYIPTRKKRADGLINDINNIKDTPLLSSIVNVNHAEEEKEKFEVNSEDDTYNASEWMDTLLTLKTEKRKFKKIEGLFGDDGNKKKKKKKKNKDGPVDHSDDFEREVMLLEDILTEQTKLSKSLQERYDFLNSQRSSARGVGKFTTDLISTLNNSRSLCKDIVKEIASIKKTTVDLNMKEREKYDKVHGIDSEDLNNFSSMYLKKIMGDSGYEDKSRDFGIEDVDDPDDIFDELNDSMKTNENYIERSDDVDKYLQYENENVSIKVLWDKSTDTKTFIAETDDGNILDDYPLPNTADSLSINPSTMVATDKNGYKYKVISE